MKLLVPVSLLFTLNCIDAMLTLYWVRNGIADESNQLMTLLLDVGDLPFLAVKIAIGIVAAVVLIRGSKYSVARYGVRFALAAYFIAIGAHVFTGLAAGGFLS